MTSPFLCISLVLLIFSCGSPGRPVGLPPPEYQEPQVPAWPPGSTAPPKDPESPPPAPSAAVLEGQGVTPAPEAPAGPPGNAGGSATLAPGSP